MEELAKDSDGEAAKDSYGEAAQESMDEPTKDSADRPTDRKPWCYLFDDEFDPNDTGNVCIHHPGMFYSVTFGSIQGRLVVRH